MTRPDGRTEDASARPWQSERVDVWAAGAVVWREDGDIAVVHRPRYDDWSLPKGKLERGETMPFAAVREVAEETGLDVHLGPLLGDVRYLVPEGRKVVRYWSARTAKDNGFTPDAEVDEVRWVSPERAAEMLSYVHDLDVLRRFEAHGRPTSTILLVRHAKAGSRSQWEGDDDQRPLSSSGREQSAHLAALLPLFGPDRLVSAPPLRCRDTIGPTAAELGMQVVDEPLLGEEAYWQRPRAGLARLRQLAALPGVTAVASQGGVIPDVVRALVESSRQRLPVDPSAVPSRKASTWVLGFTGSALRSADYYSHPTG
ncbi:MAG: NUDIX hydrolase [Pseudonocardia sp.]|nr:NUDIX hydrolase [Pseudonocardia sp.]